MSGRRWPFGGEGVGHEGSIGIGRSELRPRLGIEERASRAAHFYTDGASSITSPVGSRTTGQAATSPQYLIDDEVLLGEIVNSLIAGASYATELTGSSGDALVRLHLHLRSAVATCQLQRSGARGRDGLWMQRVLGGSVTTDTMIVLEDFTGTAWSTRLRAISFASQRLYQAFGLPACPHLTEGGQVRWAHFADARNVRRDAPNFDIELTTDVP